MLKGLYFSSTSAFESACDFFLPMFNIKHNRWDEVVDGLYLGGMPAATSVGQYGAHHKQIINDSIQKEMPLKLVISVVEGFELDGWGCFYYPASANEWNEDITDENQKIECLHIPTPDLSANISNQQILELIAKIHQTLTNENSVYVHCKAGKGRSWFIVMCYLTTMYAEKGLDFDVAREYVQERRWHVNPSSAQIARLQEFVDFYNANKAEQQQEQQNGDSAANKISFSP